MLSRITAATAHLEPPFVAADLPALDANAADLRHRALGTPIRVASKSVRVRSVLERVLAEGFRGIMAYSVHEAIWLARAGATDVLVGYPSVDADAIGTVVRDRVLSGRITLMVDSPAHLEVIHEAAGTSVMRPRVCIDVDASLRIGPVHLGVRRSPLRTPEDVAAFAARALAGDFRVVGLMFYEAQIAGIPDTPLTAVVKRRSASELAYRRRAVVDAVTDEVGSLEIVNAGGTGSLEVSAADPSVTEVTAGSGLFGPTLFDHYRAFTPAPALHYALPVVRKASDRTATVFGGGYIASGPIGRSRVPSPVGWASGPLRTLVHRAPSLLRAEGAGEVQTPVRHRPSESLAIGDRIWFRHSKAGEICERFATVHLVDADGTLTEVPTYRGEGQAFG